MIAVEPMVEATGRYTVSQAGSIMEVNRSTIHRWCVSGKVKSKHRKIDGTTVILGSELTRIWRELI